MAFRMAEDGDVPLDFGRRGKPASPLPPVRNSTSDLPTSPGTRATHCPCPRSPLSNAPTPLSPQALRIDSACRHSTAERTVLLETTSGSARHCPPPRPRLPDIRSLPRSTWVCAMAMPHNRIKQRHTRVCAPQYQRHQPDQDATREVTAQDAAETHQKHVRRPQRTCCRQTGRDR